VLPGGNFISEPLPLFLEPLQPPVAEQLSAPTTFQSNLVELKASTVVGLAVNVIAGGATVIAAVLVLEPEVLLQVNLY
jgi:hypothetical protein